MLGIAHHTMWQPKPKSEEEIKKMSTDQKAAMLARGTPTSGKQTLMRGTKC